MDMTKVTGAFRDYANLPKFHSVPHRKRSKYLTRLMQYRIMLALYCDDHMKHVSTPSVVNEKLLNDKFT